MGHVYLTADDSAVYQLAMDKSSNSPEVLHFGQSARYAVYGEIKDRGFTTGSDGTPVRYVAGFEGSDPKDIKVIRLKLLTSQNEDSGK